MGENPLPSEGTGSGKRIIDNEQPLRITAVPPIRQIVLASILATAGLLAWWLLREQEIPRNVGQTAEREPDYTVDRFTVTVMGETGRPVRRLVARESRHYPDDGGNELEEPKLTLFKEDEQPWFIVSDQGHTTEDGDEILLLGPVFIDRAAGEGTRPVHIKTYDLFIRADDEYARTERPVHITSGADWASSVTGGEFWFGDNLRARLFGRARQQIDLR